jgi:type II secretory pathway pseudopilin PulG
MTLIEALIYIGLIAIIVSGAVFSAYSIMLSQEKSQMVWLDMYQELVE